MESKTNRFADNEDIDDCDLNQLMADCEKWSHKNDLQLLSHLKQMSSKLINKTEITNQSVDSLVFETKMHCVKVDNVINEFQMLANSQFVENRVYDEEMEDIITSGHNLPNEELVNNKSKEEEILSKIKVALNIGLDFLNQRFDCVSNKVSQNDSDDENDQILEGLISNSAKDEYSQRPLPYIIGSEDFIKDNYVGLSSVEESPAIDLKTRIDTHLSDKSVDNFESKSDLFEVTNITNANNFVDYMSDSEEESNDLFGTIPKTKESNDLFGTITESQENHHKSVSVSDESDSDPFVSEVKGNPELKTNDSNQWKPSMPSFHDELSEAITAKNPENNSSLEESKDKIKAQTAVNKNQIKRVPSFESESSDENDSIFKVTKTKPKTENKPNNNFSNLFDEESNEDSMFAPISQKQTNQKINRVLSNPKTEKIIEKKSNLFDDEDDEDDLFGAINKKTTKPMKPVLRQSSEGKQISDIFTQSVSDKKKPLVSKTSLFSDDEEEDDLFSAITSKSKPNVHNSDAFESVVKPTINSVKVLKPTDSLIGELSSALKNKKLFQSDDEESDSNSDDKFSDENNSEFKNEYPSEIRRTDKEISPLNNTEVEENNESLFSDNKLSEELSSEIKTNDVSITDSEALKPSNDSILSNDFYAEEPTLTLANDGLKHRAALGAQRNRRPPTKKLLKMTPITDFDQNSETKQKIITEIEEKTPPVAAIRTVKTIISNPLSDEMEENKNQIKSEEKSFKSMSALIKSPSTEEDDIFPTQSSFKTQNNSKLFEKSESPSLPIFDDSGDNEDSLFSTNKAIKNISKKVVDNTKGLFDTSDSDDDNFLSNKSSNVISNIIKPSNSELFNDVSSTDSSLSNKSDLKIGNSKPAVSLFSDSEDDDLFSAVAKNKSMDKMPEKQSIYITEDRKEKLETIPQKLKKSNSFFSDNEEENTDLFEKKEIKTTKPKPIVKPIFDLEDDDDEDIFSPKSSTTNTTLSSKNKSRKESQSSDLFDDPLFASRS